MMGGITGIQGAAALGYLFFAPLAGGFLDGADRMISARMQRRQGPPILQPFYDLRKLLSKERIGTNRTQLMLNLCYLFFLMLAGAMLFGGMDLLLSLFVLTTADIFLVVSGASDASPYGSMGSGRELVQMMACEPLLLLIAVGFYLASGSFNVGEIVRRPASALLLMPGLFLGFLFISPVKLRKSPFDVSTSHHAHQEMVKGLTTEMSGLTLAVVTVAEYYELVLILGIVGLFILNESPWSVPAALAVCLGAYFLEILADNVCSRVRWNTLLKSSWMATLLLGGANLAVLMLR